MENIEEQQKLLCNKFNSEFVASPPFLKIGISKNIKENIFPINGLRHPIDGDTSGWYIWRGEEFLDDDDFFMPLHIEHLTDWCPEVLKYLALSPGFRFLIAGEIEDVWEDENLLNI